MHEAEAGVPPGARRARVHRIPVDGDRAARIGVVVAGENLDQRRLPEPFWPTSAWISPPITSKSTSSSAS